MSAAALRYVPGSVVAIVRPQTAVLLDVPVTDPAVTRLGELLESGAGVDDVLDALVASGLKNLADFGVFDLRPDGVRLVVRGKVSGRVGDVTGLIAERTMWYDTWQPQARSAGLQLTGSASGPWLPITSGVVLASAIASDVLASEPQLSAPAQPHAAAARPAAAPVAISGPPVTPSAPEPTEAVAAPVVVVGVPAVAEHSTQPGAQTLGPAELIEHVAAAQADAPAQSEPVASEEPELDPEPVATIDPSATMSAPLTLSAAELSAALPPEVAPAPAPASANAAGLITGMPWLATESPTSSPIPPPTPVVAPISTAVPNPAIAPVLAADPIRVPAPNGIVVEAMNPIPSPEMPAERTINRSALRGPSAATMVVAVRCAQDHLSPTYASVCRVCGAPIPAQQPVEVPRPTLGQLRLSTGGVVPLDRPAILGRNPRIPNGYTAEQPNLVRVPDPDKDVSGQHLEVQLDCWNVLVRDLGSTNGTEVILPGELPVVLRANDPVIIEPGSRVVLAGVVSFTFEVLA